MKDRDFRRQHILAALHRAGAPTSGAELADVAIALAQEEGWGRETWAGMSATTVTGQLRSMEGCGMVRKDGERQNSRAGRGEPLWAPNGPFNPAHPLPDPPEETEPQGEALTQAEAKVALECLDDLAMTVHKAMRDFESVVKRLKVRLEQAGMQ